MASESVQSSFCKSLGWMATLDVQGSVFEQLLDLLDLETGTVSAPGLRHEAIRLLARQSLWFGQRAGVDEARAAVVARDLIVVGGVVPLRHRIVLVGAEVASLDQ